MPRKERGINFALMFPGKKKDDEGNNPDFNNKLVAFNRDEHGISRWVVGPINAKEEVRMLNEIYQEQAGTTTVAYEAFLEVTGGKIDVWVSGSFNGAWGRKCVEKGISKSTKVGSQMRAFHRARDELIDGRQVERRGDGMCRLFPDLPPDHLLEEGSPTLGTG
jgi:hypothetical protein